ncbi:hypothetical protein HY008_00835 [Candidatus Woesebacteria bacterium]|nr:hypothetical protein [Candidatus Woesebacteria bacterium]
MSIEAPQLFRLSNPSPTTSEEGGPDNTADVSDKLLRLRARYASLPPEDRNSPPPEAQKPTFNPIELALNLRINPDLEKARFYTWMEMRRFIYDINAHCSAGKSLFEAVSLSTEVFEGHIKSYDAEIIKQNPVLLHLNRFGIWNGEKRMLGNNGRPVVDGIDEVERQGSVKRAAQKIEEFLLNAENNSFIVLMSPQGESGYSDENGQDTPHLNTQTMVFWKDKSGDLKGITLVTDLTIDQAEKVMEDLGAPTNFFSKKGSEMDKVATIVENPAKLSLAEEYKNPFQYVLDKILARRGLGDIRLKQKKGVELRSVDDIRQAIEKFETLLNFSLVEFRTLILNNLELVGEPIFQQTIVSKAEETVLLLGEEFLDRNNTNVIQFPSKITDIQISYDRSYPPIRTADNYARYSRVVAFLQSRGGCPTGSSVRALGGTSFGTSSGAGGSSVETGNGICGKCGRSGADNHYHCPDCNLEYADETNISPENRTPVCSCGYVFGCGNTAKDSKGEDNELAKAA